MPFSADFASFVVEYTQYVYEMCIVILKTNNCQNFLCRTHARFLRTLDILDFTNRDAAFISMTFV